MSNTREPAGDTFRKNIAKVRSVVDVLAAVSVIVTCVVVLVVSIQWWRDRQAMRRPPQTPQAIVPTEPQDIGGVSTIGNRTAPVAIIEYSDFQCTFCGRFIRDTWPVLKRDYVDRDRLLIAFRHFPLDQLHPLARKAAHSAYCAGEQGKFWEVHDRLFDNQLGLSHSFIDSMAGTIGLEASSFDKCLQERAAAVIAADEASARALGIAGTPFFLIGRIQNDGRVKIHTSLSGAQPLIRFKAVIDGLLKARA